MNVIIFNESVTLSSASVRLYFFEKCLNTMKEFIRNTQNIAIDPNNRAVSAVLSFFLAIMTPPVSYY